VEAAHLHDSALHPRPRCMPCGAQQTMAFCCATWREVGPQQTVSTLGNPEREVVTLALPPSHLDDLRRRVVLVVVRLVVLVPLVARVHAVVVFGLLRLVLLVPPVHLCKQEESHGLNMSAAGSWFYLCATSSIMAAQESSQQKTNCM